MKKFFRYLWIGTLSILPFVIVLQIFFWFQKILVEYIKRFIAVSDGNWIIVIVTLGIIISFLVLVGYSIERYGKSIFVAAIDRLMQNIPLLKTIYNFVKDFLKMVFAGKESEVFREVVIVPYPNTKLYSIGFITNRISKELMIVFVPTCPNPTSGFTVMANRKDIEFLDIDIDEAMKMVISIGAVSSEKMKEEIKKALENRLL
ncbi:DUF502 domain-containing protein [Nitrosophilus alvini]|uniref:DUF502 domain-containing protein n=1 Tax=Nitrosophilus alvini TaxID=2714855 RepID=UPI001909A816|nr:DUF502 domain-containing protein [Nitrosophilus alvini]